MSDSKVIITYCSQCNWLLRSGWYAQELLSTFGDELDEVALRPTSGGIFRIESHTEGSTQRIWDRKIDSGFPEISELKRRVRDQLFPERDLGHIDRQQDHTA